MARAIDADVFAEKIMKIWDKAESEGRADIVRVLADIVTPCLVGTPTIEPKQEWISVKDGLPKKDESVLVFWDDGFEIGIYVGGEVGDDVYWMPLPEPPEKNNEEEQA